MKKGFGFPGINQWHSRVYNTRETSDTSAHETLGSQPTWQRHTRGGVYGGKGGLCHSCVQGFRFVNHPSCFLAPKEDREATTTNNSNNNNRRAEDEDDPTHKHTSNDTHTTKDTHTNKQANIKKQRHPQTSKQIHKQTYKEATHNTKRAKKTSKQHLAHIACDKFVKHVLNFLSRPGCFRQRRKVLAHHSHVAFVLASASSFLLGLCQ